MANRFPVVDGVTVFIKPPDGYVVNFSNPQRQSALEHYLVFGILGPLAFVALCQRIYTKIFLGAGFKVDDCFMCIAWSFSVVMQSTQIYSVSIGGLCHHTWEMPIETFEKSLIVTYVAAAAFILCNGFTKTSILLYYRGISPRTWFQRSIWAACAMVSCYTIVIACMLLFGCNPIRSFWVPELLGTGRCLDSNVLYMAIAISNIVSDCVLFIIPIPTIFRVRMRLAQKLGAMVIFGIASLTLITSVVRLQLLPALLTSKDISWDAGPANVWSSVFTLPSTPYFSFLHPGKVKHLPHETDPPEYSKPTFSSSAAPCRLSASSRSTSGPRSWAAARPRAVAPRTRGASQATPGSRRRASTSGAATRTRASISRRTAVPSSPALGQSRRTCPAVPLARSSGI
ncbi:hypothetical protein RB595_004286 [Gaeumannomyces hyphopodioides]